MNIMIANENRLLGEAVGMIIKSTYNDADIRITNTAKDLIHKLKKNSGNDCEIILIDPQLSKVISPRHLHRLLPDAKVCLLHSQENLSTYDEHRKTGFNGVLTQDSSTGDVKQAMHKFLSGGEYFPETRSLFVEATSKTSPKNNYKSLLTRREEDILSLMAKGLSNKQIAGHHKLAESTVKRHVSNIYKKLHVKNRVEATQLADARGLLH